MHFVSNRISLLCSRALYLNLLGLWIVLVCAVFCGLVMYSHYKSCDPWTAEFISAPDQVQIPIIIAELLRTQT